MEKASEAVPNWMEHENPVRGRKDESKVPSACWSLGNWMRFAEILRGWSWKLEALAGERRHAKRRMAATQCELVAVLSRCARLPHSLKREER